MSDQAQIEALVGGAMLASSTDCVKLIAVDGTIEYINPCGLTLLEIDAESSLIGKPWVNLWPDETRHVAAGALASARSGEVARFTEVSPTPKGVSKWWDVAVSPIRDALGVLQRYLCVSREVTQQKAIEHSLLLSEQRFRALADNMAQLAWMADASGSVFWYNRRWTEYTGATVAEMKGSGWRKVHHPEFVKHVVERVNYAFKHSEMWEDELPLRAADGSYRWFLSRAMPVHDAQGRVVLWCATHTDVTEQRSLSQRLRQLARVIELSHEAILVWSPEDGIVLWNKGCEELYGYHRGEALGKKTHSLLRSLHPKGLDAIELELLRDGEWSGEIRHRAKDASEVWVDSRQELIRAGGRNLVLESNRDITDRRKADAIRDLLVAELDHRVKNMLAIVQSLAAQTARTQPDIASFSASFSGRLQSLASAQAILSDAQWVGADLRELVASQLAITVGTSEQALVSGDAVFLSSQAALQLTLILHELATNARQHGALSRPSGRVEIKWHVEGPEVELIWREIGGPHVASPAARGFGRKLIERTGQLPYLKSRLEFLPDGVQCRIWVSSSEGGQAGVPYFNPSPRRTALQEAQAETRPGGWRTLRRILVVEDDPLDGLRIEETLADAGYLIVGPIRTSEALGKALQEMAFDAAIIDSQIDAVDLDDVLANLAANDRPILLIGGNGDDAAHLRHISRPLAPGQLIEGLRELLGTAPSGTSASR
ncbi:MAG: PAS domain S-box protein [Hyphomicrobiaceae bacterium]